MHTRRTLFLNPDTWDLALDGVGRIALTHEESATAQNVAGEARLFTDDAYFVQDQGIPHYIVELGHRVSRSVLSSHLRRAALRVRDVKEVLAVEVTAVNPQTRVLSGAIRFSSVAGANKATVTTYF